MAAFSIVYQLRSLNMCRPIPKGKDINIAPRDDPLCSQKSHQAKYQAKAGNRRPWILKAPTGLRNRSKNEVATKCPI